MRSVFNYWVFWFFSLKYWSLFGVSFLTRTSDVGRSGREPSLRGCRRTRAKSPALAPGGPRLCPAPPLPGRVSCRRCLTSPAEGGGAPLCWVLGTGPVTQRARHSAGPLRSPRGGVGVPSARRACWQACTRGVFSGLPRGFAWRTCVFPVMDEKPEGQREDVKFRVPWKEGRRIRVCTHLFPMPLSLALLESLSQSQRYRSLIKPSTVNKYFSEMKNKIFSNIYPQVFGPVTYVSVTLKPSAPRTPKSMWESGGATSP